MHLYIILLAGMKRGIYSLKVHDCSDEISKEKITRDVFQLIHSEFGTRVVGRVKVYPASSCEAIRQFYNDIGSGYYWIASGSSQNASLMYCFT